MSKYPALPLFGDAFSAATWHLSDAEVGRYIRLLLLMWETPSCRLPNDDAWLARRLKKSVDEVKSEIRPIIKEFCKTDGNWIWQKRLRKEFAYVKNQSKKQSDIAKSAWEKRKGVHQNDTARHQSGNAPHLTSPHLLKDTPIVPKGTNGQDYEKAFEEFFAAYPRRQGSNPRKTAFKSYVRVRRAGASQQEILTGLGAYAAHVRATGKERTEFVAQAATWLNQERWKDDYGIGNRDQEEARRKLDEFRTSNGSDGKKL